MTECSASGLETRCALQGPPVAPSPEACNGRDDDCDGFVDEQGVCGTAEVGGAFDSHAPALSCQFESDEPEDWSGSAIGFRCCTEAH